MTMSIFDITQGILFTLPLLITSSIYVLISAISLHSSKRNTTIDKNKNYSPLISIIIPTFNEERIIKKSLENILETSYPAEKIEIIVVDSSTDNTPQIVRRFSINHVCVKLLHDDKRTGLATGLNKAYKICSGDIIVKTDADVLIDKNTLTEMISNFADPTIGAVTGRLNVVNNVSNEKNYRSIQQIIQSAESRIDSVYMTHTLVAYRRSLIRAYDPREYGDETIQTIHIRKQGFRVIYDSEANFYEPYPESTKERFSQKVRRAEGHVRILLDNLDMFFNRKYKRFGTYVFPANFFMIIISPLLLSLGLALLILDLVLYSSMIILDSLVLTLIVALFLLRRKPIAGNAWSIIELQFAQLLAMKNVLFRKDQHLWQKVNREINDIRVQQHLVK